MNPLVKLFSERSMGFKLTVVLVSVVLVPMLLLAYVSYRIIDSRLMRQASDELSTGMKAAWTEYYIRGEQMRYGMLQAAAMDEMKDAVRKRDRERLRKMMSSWKQMRPYVDVWAVTDASGMVIARMNTAHHGDMLLLGGLVPQAVSMRQPQSSTELIDQSIIEFEGNELKERISFQGIKDAKAGVLALAVATPVLDERGSAIGVIVTADVFNNDSFVPDMLSYKLPGFFATISATGTRVASNVTDLNGRSAKGTRIDASVLGELATGKGVSTEWSIPGHVLISRYEPIKNLSGKVIGSLDVSISKEKTWAVQRENQQAIIVITLIGLSLSVFAALLSTSRITRPLRELKDRLADYASGDLGARIEVGAVSADSADEISVLGRTFNKMMEEVNRREHEKERYLREIERKNSELAGLNSALKTTNEELEIAYEETQSQTEELHAINEELKLLNEDLDRKNLELQKANRIITQEEQELKKARNKLRLIYDSIRDCMLLVGYDYRILEANSFFLDSQGVTEEMAIGRNVYSYFGGAAPKNCPIRRSIDTYSPSELEMTTSDGKILLWQAYPIAEGGGEPRSAVVYIQDVTDRRLLTQKLIQADKLSSLGELVSGVAHELNNPLTGIMCFSELLMDDKLGETANSKLRKINEASHRCKKIIDNLLTFARWKKPEKRFEDPNRVLRDCVEFRAYQLKMDNIQVELDLESSIPWTMLDSNQVQQVVLNLINNARDAIREKGGAGKIKVSTRHASGKIIIGVEDTGMGISDEIANRIFDPFFTTKDVGKGTGLGLSISYGIIHEHGGNIYASSRPGQGTTFIIELPVIQDQGPCGEVFRAALERLRVDGLKALVLDDEPIVLDLLSESLSGFGFAVDRASSAEEALKRLADHDYSIIISDIKMPGLDGKGFYREVQGIRPSALKKIVFVSGDSMSRDTQEFLQVIGTPSLRKPFSIDELSEVVSKVIL